MGTLGGFVIPLYVGKLLGMNPEQMTHAVGIAGTFSPTLGVIDAPGEENNMTKNIGNPLVARTCIHAALLAKRGFTGPTRVIEGNRGFLKTIVAGEFDTEALFRRREPAMITQTIVKYLPLETYAMGPILAVLELVREHDIVPDRVESVTIRLSTFGADHIGDPEKRHPRNKETADHSLHYLAAVAIMDRCVTVDSYTEDRLRSPVVGRLIDRIEIEGDPGMNRFVQGGIAEIRTTDGRTLTRRIDYPKGHYENPMTDGEVAEKFRTVSWRYMKPDQIGRVIETVFDLEELKDIAEVMELLAFTTR